MEIIEIIENKFGIVKRFVEKKDALFILQLRQDEKLGRFLSSTSPEIEVQEKWIEQYKIKENNGDEFYFIFCDKNSEIQYGVNRIYDICANSFEIGSWLFSPESPEGLSILADLSTRDYAFDISDFEYCKFDVRKANKNVLNYHKRFQPELIGEDELNYYFKLDREKYFTHRNYLLNMFGYGIE
jgi:RimJ/RimL family protein N-acetyltransferase